MNKGKGDKYMQFNKCSRCGCFFVTNDSVCPNCKPKDISDMNKLKGFLEEVNPEASIEEISCGTGISTKNLHRLFCSDELANFNFTDLNGGPKTQL